MIFHQNDLLVRKPSQLKISPKWSFTKMIFWKLSDDLLVTPSGHFAFCIMPKTFLPTQKSKTAWKITSSVWNRSIAPFLHILALQHSLKWHLHFRSTSFFRILNLWFVPASTSTKMIFHQNDLFWAKNLETHQNDLSF